MRADELIKEREPILQSEQMKKWVWYTCDLHETLTRIHRQSYKNDASDFADSELLLQDFIQAVRSPDAHHFQGIAATNIYEVSR